MITIGIAAVHQRGAAMTIREALGHVEAELDLSLHA